MNEKEILIESIKAIKEYLLDEKYGKSTRLGLYMALNTIKGTAIGVDEDLLEALGLNEDFEKYL